MDQPDQEASEETLTGIYHLRICPGVFQAFCVKADYGRENRGTHTDVLMEKGEEALERNLKAREGNWCFLPVKITAMGY